MHRGIAIAAIATLFGVSFPAPVVQAEATSIIFPVLGGAEYWNDFGTPRSGGRTHQGNDLLAAKHTPLIAPESGRIAFVAFPERSWGMSISLLGDSGWNYQFLHINNDRPGTDDNSAIPWFAYAPDISEGNHVRAGQIIGFVGDSGNAEQTRSHVHFEMRNPSGNITNPYDSLLNARIFTTQAPPYIQHDEILPYRDVSLGANITIGQFDNDTALEFATAPLAGGGPHVRFFDSDGESLFAGFFAYQPDYPGGLDLAAGDLDRDGVDELITAPGPGGTAHIKTFTPDGTAFGVEFLAYPKGFEGGAFVSAADVDNDGEIEIVTGAGPGGTPHVRVFSAQGKLKREFLAYPRDFAGGVDVAAADGIIVTAPGRGGGPHIKIFDGETLELLDEFLAYDSGFLGGVRVSARGRFETVAQPDDRYGPTQPEPQEEPQEPVQETPECEEVIELDAYGRILKKQVCPSSILLTHTGSTTSSISGALAIATAPASDGGPDIRLFNQSGERITRTTMFDPWWQGGYDVAIGIGTAWVITGKGPEPNVGRRISARELPRGFTLP